MAKNQNNNVAPATQKTEPGAKKDALATALAQIEKQFGKGAIMKLGDNTAMQVDAISTGSLGLDLALGVGGVPRGRIIEVFGPESSGKTTLALHILAEAQKKGGEVAFIDVEHALDPAYASALGVNIDELLVSQPDTGEQAMEICEALVRSGAIDAIVVDSVAAMVPRAEIEGEMGDSHVGLQARLMSQAMRKLTSVIGKTNTVMECFMDPSVAKNPDPVWAACHAMDMTLTGPRIPEDVVPSLPQAIWVEFMGIDEKPDSDDYEIAVDLVAGDFYYSPNLKDDGNRKGFALCVQHLTDYIASQMDEKKSHD